MSVLFFGRGDNYFTDISAGKAHRQGHRHDHSRALEFLGARIAPEVDRLIFIMLDYRIVEIRGRKSAAMFTAFHSGERTDFVFTRRT